MRWLAWFLARDPARLMRQSSSCFHCGEPVTVPGRFSTEVDGERRSLCCAGCEAAARLIAEMGLERYYLFREQGGSPRPPEPGDIAQFEVYDRPQVLACVSQGCGGGTAAREADILLEGIRCAACVWLLESSLSQLDGVEEVQVALATGRMRLQWDPARIRLSEVLARIAALGYGPQPVQGNVVLEQQASARRTALKRLFVAAVGMMQVMTFAVAVYIGLPLDMEERYHQFFRVVSLLVATPVVFYSAAPFFQQSLRDLRRRTISMDVPVALAIGGAYAASLWFTWTGHGEVYFDSVTMFTFFLLLGRYLEMQARHRTGDVADALARLQPQTAWRLDAAGQAEQVGLAELRPGDRVRVRNGETFPADGRLLAGQTRVDESLLTGESQPRPRTAGEQVIGGSLNLGGTVDCQVERIGGDTLLSGIARMLQRAQAERPPIALAADRVARWFVAGILVVAAVVYTAWSQLDPSRAFEITLAVLVVTCPCALSLAMPTALTTGTGALARAGLMITRAGSLERLARADALLLDKTGTLTLGRIRVTAVAATALAGSTERALALAAALEAHSDHPLAGAFAQPSMAAELPEAHEVQVVAGRGLEGLIDGVRYRIGNRSFVADWLPAADLPVDAKAGTEVLLATAAGLLASFTVEDQLRPATAQALAELRQLGLEPRLASGDQPAAVAAVAGSLGIRHWQGGLLPADKLALTRKLQAAGRRVAMVGDGINDAPVLAGADVSIALARGTPLAQNAAGIVLLGESLAPLPVAVRLARRTLAVIRQNLALSLGYNISAIPLAAMGLIPPWLAAIGMSLSSLVVVLNALRLSRSPAARGQATGGAGPALTAGEPAR
jgi:Cu2+-exporting ATPase